MECCVVWIIKPIHYPAPLSSLYSLALVPGAPGGGLVFCDYFGCRRSGCGRGAVACRSWDFGYFICYLYILRSCGGCGTLNITFPRSLFCGLPAVVAGWRVVCLVGLFDVWRFRNWEGAVQGWTCAADRICRNHSHKNGRKVGQRISPTSPTCHLITFPRVKITTSWYTSTCTTKNDTIPSFGQFPI